MKILLILLYALGLYISLKLTFAVSSLDSDVVQAWEIWNGVHQHGLAWIPSFIFTQDNWLFSLTPIYFLEFWIFGAAPNTCPEIFIVTGWGIFLGSIFLIGLIAHELNFKKSAYLLPIFFLFSGAYVYQSGYLVYPVCHNISVFWGLLTTWLLMRYIRADTQVRPYIFLIFLINFINIFSDPWAEAAFSIPMGLTALTLFFSSPKKSLERKKALCIIGILLLGEILKYALCLTIFSFLSPSDLIIPPAREILENLGWALVHIGGFFNFFSFAPWPLSASAVLSFFILLSVIFLLVRADLQQAFLKFKPWVQSYKNNIPVFFLMGLAFFSCILILFFYAISLSSHYHLIHGETATARYLINVFFWLPLVIFILLEKKLKKSKKFLKYFLFLLGALYFISNFSSDWVFIKSPGFVIQDKKNMGSLITYLKSQNLNYGYGGYFSADADTLTLSTQEKIIMRPIQFDFYSGRPMYRERSWSSLTWYSPSDYPKDQKYFYVIVDGQNWALGCTTTALCVQGLMQTYGPPVKMLSTEIIPSYRPLVFNPTNLATRPVEPVSILIYDHPLLNFENKNYLNIKLNQTIFANTSLGLPAWPGFPRPNKYGTWSDGETADMYLNILDSTSLLIAGRIQDSPLHRQDKTGLLKLNIQSRALLLTKTSVMKVSVWANGEYLSTWTYDFENNNQARSVSIPIDLILKSQGKLHIQFKINKPVLPKEINYLDQRSLGILLKSFSVGVPFVT